MSDKNCIIKVAFGLKFPKAIKPKKPELSNNQTMSPNKTSTDKYTEKY